MNLAIGQHCEQTRSAENVAEEETDPAEYGAVEETDHASRTLLEEVYFAGKTLSNDYESSNGFIHGEFGETFVP